MTKHGLRIFAPGRFGNLPPVLVNSFPKSGTHLLSQIVQGLPSNRDWGEFFVSTPSLTMREVPAQTMGRRLSRLTPGETATAHLFWSDECAKTLRSKGVAHYFIYRDLRDVVLSEAHYLTDMNRWHRLHREFKGLRDFDDRLMLAIAGSESLLADGIFYPDVAKRFEKYKGWLGDADTLCLRFEDLRGENRDAKVGEVTQRYLDLVQGNTHDVDLSTMRQKCLDSIAPERSHTYRQGKRGGWRSAFNAEHKRVFKQVAGTLLIELGYESDLDW